MTGNTAKTGGGSEISRSFRDLFTIDKEPAQSSEEIITTLRAKLKKLERSDG